MEQGHVTQLLRAAASGDRAASSTLIDLVYEDLRLKAARLMRAERAGHTLQPTALVNEAFVRLVRQERVDWKSRAHFFAVAATLMRRILVDHARKRNAERRGGGEPTLSLREGLGLTVDNRTDVLEVHQALERLEEASARQAEVVVLRFFGGLTVPEIAAILGLSTRTIEGDWTVARAWLRRELAE